MVPEDFTLGLAAVDSIPVLFFGMSAIVISLLFDSKLFLLGAVLSFWAGAAKVLWKFIVVLQKKNIWFLFVQMRIVMPIGFLLMLASLAINAKRVSMAAIGAGLCSFPSCIFFLIGMTGMILMMIFAVKLDNGNVKANWIEQLTNGAAQIAFFIGLVLLI